ncbi:hypothetical protein [Azorhizobium doebereinerae]|uniref:hypothetical protein n=1 Tax=Azorhizobium doebereinerae TaxID=281091 RepID=UPI0004244454|nr:hypothetical protein [Azorhizobium doebereinerae]
MITDLRITQAAPDRGLLSIEELRAAASVSDSTQDASLLRTGLAVADTISGWCCVAGAGIAAPTLRQETLAQTFWPKCAVESLILARRFLGTVSVVENGATLNAADFFANERAGVLTRLNNGSPCRWQSGIVVVTYQAGFADVPTDLAEVAAEMVSRRSGTARDPMLKRERVDVAGIEQVEREYWVDAAAAVDITPDMADVLGRYKTIQVG